MLAVIAAAILSAAPQHDTVYMVDGGRTVGMVVEEGPQEVTVQLPDGTLRKFARRNVLRIEYADGSVSTLTPRPVAEPAPQSPAIPASVAPTPSPSVPPPESAPPPPTYTPPPPTYTPPPPPSYTPPPPPAYTPPPPPAYAPPPSYPPPPPRYVPPPRYSPYGPPPAYERTHRGPISPFYLSLGIGGASFAGEAEPGWSMSDLFEPQVALEMEGGIRITPHTALALYGDVGAGDPARDVRSFCSVNQIDCHAQSGRFGILVRRTFNPNSPTTPWISAGTGAELGSVSYDDGTGTNQDLFKYSGWEMLRLQAGIDFRSNQVFGFGLYGGVRVGRYDKYEDALGVVHLSDRTTHTTIEGGLRLTLFP